MSRRKLPVLVEQSIGSIQAESMSRSQAFERMVRKKETLSCKEGCSNCCHLPIEITIAEAFPIYRELVQKGRWTPAFVKTIKEHAEFTAFLDPTVWILTRIPCPLLSNNRCTVYGVRPFHCRTMWATGDPFYCNGQNFGPQTSIVTKNEIVKDFLAYEEMLSKQVGLPHYLMSISRALLMVEQIVMGKLEMRDVYTEIVRSMGGKP